MPCGFPRVALGAVVLAASAASLSAQAPGGPAAAARAQEKAAAQSAAAQATMIANLNAIGFAQLDARVAAMAAITTRAAAEARQRHVRQAVVDAVGGVPRATAGPVVAKRFATVEDDGFRIENIAYESIPGYWVTANVYVPAGTGPFPALVVAPGHGAGKASQYSWAANFARAGFLTLAIDPMGQGERMQHFDPELGTSKVEPSGEHEHGNQTALLVGQHIARYWFADGVRSVDYLTQRADVDAARIGTFGCSGGGTAAAYLAAMDPRVKAAAIASFITSFKTLMPGNGPQDAEQTLPRFIASGLDFADWVELAAPRPVAIVAFETDFFPIAGAKDTFEEAKRFYGLFGASDAVHLIHGQGGHCNLGPVSSQVFAFLTTHLKGPGAPVATFAPARAKNPDALTVTPTGQAALSLGSLTVEELARRRAQQLTPAVVPIASAAAIEALRARVQRDIRAVAVVTAVPGASPKATATPKATGDGFRTEALALESEVGVTLEGVVGLPAASGPHPAVLWMDAAPVDDIAASPDFARLVKAGSIVLALHPRGVLGEPPPTPTQLALGPYMALFQRAVAVGKTIVGLRVDDTIRAVDWLAARPDVDRSAITVYGTGAQGMVAMHAAALDPRLSRIVVERTLVSYRTALDAGLHRNLSEVLIPSVLAHYDTPDLLVATHPRPVVLVNPANAMGQPDREGNVRAALKRAIDADAALRTPTRIRIARRGFGDPVPIE
jgi:cephalosporin-C deacetylase-like acetyl esterase